MGRHKKVDSDPRNAKNPEKNDQDNSPETSHSSQEKAGTPSSAETITNQPERKESSGEPDKSFESEYSLPKNANLGLDDKNLIQQKRKLNELYEDVESDTAKKIENETKQAKMIIEMLHANPTIAAIAAEMASKIKIHSNILIDQQNKILGTQELLQQTVQNVEEGAAAPSKDNIPMETSPIQGAGEKFTTPKKTARFTTTFVSKNTTETSNRFGKLEVEKIHTVRDEIDTAAQKTIKPKSNPTSAILPKPQKSKIPPIVLEGIPARQKEMSKQLASLAKGGYYIKYTYNSTLIYANTLTDHNKIKEALTEEKKEYHTYATPETATHAFVLRGLDADVDIDDIKNELSDVHNIDAKNVFKMKTQRRPLYLVVTAEDVTMKHLIANVRYLLHIKVTWERRRNERRINQCRRCQAWGHSASNCHRAPRCMKCAEGHFTYECVKDKDHPAKCCNCGGQHTACNTECPVYIKRVAMLEPREEAQQTTYVPAPAPTTNAWEDRRKAAKAQTTTSQPQTTVQRGPAPTASGRQPQQQQQTSNQPRRQQQSATISAVGGADTSASANVTSDIGDIRALFGEIQQINQKINIRQALLAFREFNAMLGDGSMDKLGKFAVLESFITNVLPKYDF